MVLFVLKGGGGILAEISTIRNKKIVNILNWGDEKLSRLLALTSKIVWRSRAVATGGLGSSALPPPKKL